MKGFCGVDDARAEPMLVGVLWYESSQYQDLRTMAERDTHMPSNPAHKPEGCAVWRPDIDTL